MTIKLNDLSFDGPFPIARWDPPRKAAVYAMMIPANEANIYKVIYIGESENLSERGFYTSHHAYQCWIKHAGNETRLYISIYSMLNSTIQQRREVEQKLIKYYNPVCNM